MKKYIGRNIGGKLNGRMLPGWPEVISVYIATAMLL